MRKTAAEYEALGDHYAYRNYPSNDFFENPNLDIKRARGYYQLAIELDPNNARCWAKLSKHFYSSLDKPIEAINHALELEPGNPEFLVLKAHLLINHGGEDADLDEADVCVNQVLSRDPQSIPALFAKHAVLEARADNTLRLIKPERNVESITQAAIGYSRAGKGEKLIRELHKLTNMLPGDKEIWTELYRSLLVDNKYYQAEAIPAEKLTFEYEVSLEEFCRTGQYGPVKLGMSRWEVIEAFGQPESTSDFDHRYNGLENEGKVTMLHNVLSERWWYNESEFWFSRYTDLLYRISLKDSYNWRTHSSRKIKIDPWIFRRQPGLSECITKIEFVQALNNAGTWFC